TIPNNVWTHLAFTYDGSGIVSGMKIYIDGESEEDTALTLSYTAMHDTSSDMFFGNQGTPILDDVRIFNKELAAHEIKTLYKNGKGTEKPIGYCQYISGGTARKVGKTISGLGHLVGETVTVLQDGGDAGTQDIAVASITLDDYYNKVHAGLPITARLQPMKLEMATKPGSLFGRPKRIAEITIRFFETSGCDVGPSWTDYDSYLFRDVSDPLDIATPLYSGDKTIAFDGDYELAGNIFIQSRLPLPLTISALMADYEVAP
ncbi:unnamed protein product, partial [marine sediment metagenome]